VTVEGESALTAARARFGGAMTRLAVSRLEPVGGLSGWRPLMPVTQWIAAK
jgi:precorrin-6Y C5,15-methyltransferase (decarboxylating)